MEMVETSMRAESLSDSQSPRRLRSAPWADKAFEWLQISYDNHDTGLLSLLIDPLMRGLRGDARYKGMLEKIGLPTSP